MGKEHTMTPAEIEALERRNRQEQDFIVKELKEIKYLARSSDNAIRGKNGDTGLIADVKIIQTQLEAMEKAHAGCDKKFGNLDILLFGKDKDDAGAIGEQIALRKYVFGDLKPSIDRMSWWFFTLVGGLILTGIISTIIQSNLTTP